jgi:hypothetical protein
LGVDPPEREPTEDDRRANAEPLGLPVKRFVLPGHLCRGNPTPKTTLPPVVPETGMFPVTTCKLVSLLPPEPFEAAVDDEVKISLDADSPLFVTALLPEPGPITVRPGTPLATP